MTVVHRPGHHDSRPDEKANGDEGPSIGAHYTNNPGCKGTAMTESYVNIWGSSAVPVGGVIVIV